MFESIGRSFALVKTSWNILMDDKKLLVFPLLSGIVSLIVLLTFALPLILTGSFMNNTGFGPVMFYGLLFVFYAASYFVVIFFNTALITCVNARLNGKEATINDGLSNATKHIGSILAWSLVSATVGIILQVLEDNVGFIGQIAAALIGGAWGLVTFFVVPILVLEDKGVVDSVKDSVSLIKKTWGESIVGGGSIFLVFLVIGIIAAIAIFGIWMVSQSFLLAIALLIIVVAILAVVASAMQGIFVTALYTYARTGTVPTSFNKDLIENAFMPKLGSTQGNI
ncbi:MAG: hypothetical protein CVV30_00065 [Methanomicrobiales archaeon HGW-Methanomicrobiales-1]|jgi:hypothetical protein|nr:MAG: hypothetical protein CVV30_00065 [Methanomicrobiales archaeon HGW-Methanomicrobiales-1]